MWVYYIIGGVILIVAIVAIVLRLIYSCICEPDLCSDDNHFLIQFCKEVNNPEISDEVIEARYFQLILSAGDEIYNSACNALENSQRIILLNSLVQQYQSQVQISIATNIETTYYL